MKEWNRNYKKDTEKNIEKIKINLKYSSLFFCFCSFVFVCLLVCFKKTK